MILSSPEQRRHLLERSKSIALVGASADPSRPSHGVFVYLRAHGYDVTPINPALTDVDGVTAYRSLTAYAAERGAPDIVDVFRKSADVLPIAHEAVAIGAKALWLQLDIVNDDAIAFGVVRHCNHCIRHSAVESIRNIAGRSARQAIRNHRP